MDDHKSLNLKMVYYGPPESGKTTNIKHLHQQVAQSRLGQMMTLATATDRTVFFDFLSFEMGTMSKWKVFMNIYSVPGHESCRSTRKLLLRGADGIIFTLSANPLAAMANLDFWQELNENLPGLSTGNIPVLLQLNKTDIAQAFKPDRIAKSFKKPLEDIVPARARQGDGVYETFTRCFSRIIENKLN